MSIFNELGSLSFQFSIAQNTLYNRVRKTKVNWSKVKISNLFWLSIATSILLPIALIGFIVEQILQLKLLLLMQIEEEDEETTEDVC